MHYNLLFNGCSFTYGWELGGINNDEEHQRTHRFSHLVADHYGKTYDNISRNGKSNDWIVEKTINWFENGNTCDLAVIQFTDNKRTIIYDDKDKKDTPPREYDVYKPILLTDKSVLRQYKSLLKVHIGSNLYFKNIYTEYMGQQNYYKNLFFLNNYFKTKNIPTLFLKMIKDTSVDFGWKLHCENIKVKDIAGDITPVLREDKEKIYYCKDYSYKYKEKEKKDWHLKFLIGSHPNEFGHQKIADYIIDNSSNIF